AHEHSTEAIPAILTGKEPDEVKLPVLADHPRNLFTLLPESYRFDVFESATRLCPSERCPRREEPFLRRLRWLTSDVSDVYLQILLPDELAKRLPPVTQTWMNFGDEGESRRRADAVRYDAQIDVMVGHEFSKDQVLLFETFVSSVAPTRKPALHFLHVLLPHSPWQYLPSGARYPNGIAIDGLNIDSWRKDEWLATQGWQRHLLQTMYADRLLGRLLDRLRATDLYDRSLVVVLADHGVSFRPGERRRGATRTNLHDIAFVPLFVKKPFQREPRVEDEHVEAVDILPSLADVLDLPVPAPLDGASFFSRAYAPDDEVRVYRRAGEPPVVRPFSSLLRGRHATVAEQSALFGSGNERQLFEIGPHARALIGRRLEVLRVGRSSSLSAKLAGRGRLADVVLSSGVVPARLTGTLEGEGAHGGLALAVALNGRVAATTRSYEDGDTVRFSALVPEAALRDGANDIAVFRSARRGGALVLEPVPLG
ncbi:MAG: sulfatase-like hydrolase/transferase, partial [Actinomycetota bacterium]|nr:sulfatase-like hydrolase/transferase [Actinomycetota bacterium]